MLARVVLVTVSVMAGLASSAAEPPPPVKGTIYEAASVGDLSTLQRLLEDDPKLVSATDKREGKTALNWAARSGQIEAVRLLVKYKAEIDHRDKWGGTPLEVAAYAGHAEVVRLLVDEGANVNAIDSGGHSVLNAVSCRQQCAIASFLVERGAAVDGGRTGVRPVNWFVSVGDVDCTKAFVARGADLKARDLNGDTAAHWLAKGSDFPTEGSFFSGPPRFRELVDMLVAAGSDLNAPNNMKEAPLHTAAAAKTLVVADALISAGANVDARERSQRTPLMVAANSGSTEIVRLLVSHKADVSAKDQRGSTPLILAVRQSVSKAAIEDMARLLIDAGADVNARTPGGGYGVFGDDGTNALQQAAESGDTAVAELLIRAGANVNQPFKDGRTPLWWAAKNGHTAMVELLIKSGADVNANAKGRTALKAARDAGRTEIIALLVNQGATE